MNNKQELNDVHKLIFEKRNIGELYPVLHQLHSLYSAASGISADDLTDASIDLPSGKAVSPISAAHCLLEIGRTSRFLNGIYKAILKLQNDFCERPIRILYAGSGPYATLVTPLTSLFSPEQISFDIMDINEVSLQAVKKMYANLGLLPFVNSFILGDATLYKIPTDRQPHLVIAETLNAALKNEPQVSLMLNLVPQLQENAIFIPQNIAVDAYLLSIGQETAAFFVDGAKPERIFLGNIYFIGQAQCEKHQSTTVQLPEDIGKNNMLSLLTEITVFGDEKLGIYDCSLTLPQNVRRLPGNSSRQLIEFRYRYGPKPCFEHQFITADPKKD